ncbi:hypothetical protein OSB04_013953 [Centaurea solstitialis]|uniref:Glycosyltransferase n=1 Tax=Centaurea solstitialis TaxID=347529 RepID=A0AA38WQX2_9ASTR|nr:hypothetical protein OSB04_013953 [Centaurea solstitialis]
MASLHFVLFPLMEPGHMIPMVDIARILAARRATVTIITTPVNAARFRAAVDRAVGAGLEIRLLEVRLPLAEVGLPEGFENFDLLPSADLHVQMFAAMDMLERPTEDLLRGLSPPPSCIVSDNLFPWTTDVARRLGIPRLVFYGPGCFTYLCLHIAMNTDVLDGIESDSETFVVPGIFDEIKLTKAQAGSWGKRDSDEMVDMFRRMDVAEKGAYGIVVNSFDELEPKYVEELAKVKGKKVWCIGPVSLCNRSLLDIAERGKKSGIDEHDCLKWLDKKETASVIFVCLGSMSSISNEQMFEIGSGLEASNVAFIWCVRRTTEESERWLLGFEERVNDRGLIVRSWAPQVLILSHKSVGGFVTHCGWNSNLEGVTAGLPMVTWPHFADQFLNERFIVDVLKIGVSVGMEEVVVVGDHDKFGVLVKKDDIKKSVERIMGKDEEAEERRTRARELGKMAKRAMEEMGSSHRNTTSMIQDIIEQLDNK